MWVELSSVCCFVFCGCLNCASFVTYAELCELCDLLSFACWWYSKQCDSCVTVAFGWVKNKLSVRPDPWSCFRSQLKSFISCVRAKSSTEPPVWLLTQKHQCTMGFAMHIQENKKMPLTTCLASVANIRYGKTIVLLLVEHLPNYVPWQLAVPLLLMAPHRVTVPEKTRQECWETRRILLSRQIIIIDLVFHLNLFCFCLNMFALQYLILYCHMVSNFPLAFLLSYHMNAPTWTTNELPREHRSSLIKLLILLGFHPTKAKGPFMPNLNTKFLKGSLFSRDGGGGLPSFQI